MWFLQLVDPVNHLFYHEAMTDLSLGWTSISQDSWIKGASLHPSLFSQCIKSGIITKLGLHNVRETVKEWNNKGYNVIDMSGFGASWYRLWCTGHGLQVYWTRQQHLDLTLCICRAIGLVGSPTQWVPPGSMLEAASVTAASGSFGNFTPNIKGFWQCKAIGRGVLWTHRLSK